MKGQKQGGGKEMGCRGEGVGCPNWGNRSLFVGDNLDVLRGMNSESVDLIYLDPPFNSNRNYSAVVGSESAGLGFRDAWGVDDIDEGWLGVLSEGHPNVYRVCELAGDIHSEGMKFYLVFMSVRLIELHRVLKATGCLYLHCDPTASHYLKLILDVVFGRDNFKNEIVWCYGGRGMARGRWNRKHDSLLFYGAPGFEFNEAHATRPVKAEHVVTTRWMVRGVSMLVSRIGMGHIQISI